LRKELRRELSLSPSLSFFKDFIYLRERESEADSALSAEPHAGLDPTIVRSQPELKPRAARSTD